MYTSSQLLRKVINTMLRLRLLFDNHFVRSLKIAVAALLRPTESLYRAIIFERSLNTQQRRAF